MRAVLQEILRADLRRAVDLPRRARAAVGIGENALRRHVLRLTGKRAKVPRGQQRRRAQVDAVLELVGEKRALERVGLRDERIGVGLTGKERNE